LLHDSVDILAFNLRVTFCPAIDIWLLICLMCRHFSLKEFFPVAYVPRTLSFGLLRYLSYEYTDPFYGSLQSVQSCNLNLVSSCLAPSSCFSFFFSLFRMLKPSLRLTWALPRLFIVTALDWDVYLFFGTDRRVLALCCVWILLRSYTTIDFSRVGRL